MDNLYNEILDWHASRPTPSEEGAAFYAALYNEGWSIQDVAEAIGRSEDYVYSRLRLYAMPEQVQDDVDCGRITLTQTEDLRYLHQRIPYREFRKVASTAKKDRNEFNNVVVTFKQDEVVAEFRKPTYRWNHRTKNEK